MTDHKYKVGDKVRIVGNGDVINKTKHCFDIGDVAEIGAIMPDGVLALHRLSDGLPQYVEQEHVEIVKEGQA